MITQRSHPSVIRDDPSLRAFIDRCRHFSLAGGEHITFALPNVPAPEQQALEAMANKLWNECGCSAGAACALGGIGFYAFLCTLHAPGPAVWIGAVGAIVFFGAGTIGKLLGMFVARRRLIRLLQAMAERSSQASASPAPIPPEPEPDLLRPHAARSLRDPAETRKVGMQDVAATPSAKDASGT